MLFRQDRESGKETMYRSKKNSIKLSLLLLLSMLVMGACTRNDSLILEEDLQEDGRKTGEVTDSEAVLSKQPESGNESGQIAEAEETRTEIYVHICGAVMNPGVYALEAGSRIFEGIEAAGGFSEDACEDYVNQAKPLQDGQRLVIPTVEELEEARKNGTYQEPWMTDEDISLAVSDGLININTATESELSSINGIGPGKAAAIVAYRQENGSFASIEDIMSVSGIGEGTFEKIKDKITVK